MKKEMSALSSPKAAHLILESIPSPVVMIDNGGMISYLNGSMEKLLNAGRADVLGKPLVQVLFLVQGFSSRGIYRNPVMETLLTGRELSDQPVEIQSTGLVTTRVLQISTFIIRGGRGKNIGVCAIFSDHSGGGRFLQPPDSPSKKFETVFAFAEAMGARDGYTMGHSEKVAEYSRLIAEKMGLEAKVIDLAYLCGMVHDVGKLSIPEDVLNKKGPLSTEEYKVVKGHCRMGAEILSHISWLEEMVPGIESHHEKYNGSGYPSGLKGEQIPLLGRILAVADAFDAMTSDRSYRKAYTVEKAVEELRKNAGSQFDPEVVEIFIEMIKEYS